MVNVGISPHNPCWIFLFLILPSLVECQGNLTVGLLLPFQSAVATGSDFNAGKWYASAIEVALQRVNNDSSFLPSVHINYIWNETGCEEERALRNMAWQFQQKVDGFIGFGCTCATQARFAAAWNMPVISYVSTW